MGRSKKFDYQATIESSLLAHPDGLTLDELLERSGLEVDRSTLFRHLAQLIQQGRAERFGKARASRYRPLNAVQADPHPEPQQAQQPAVQPVPEVVERPAPIAVPQLTPSSAVPAQHAPRPVPDKVPAAAPEYGIAVKKAVRTVVRDWKRLDDVNLRIYLSLLVKREHVEDVAAAVEIELARLHEGNLHEYGLTPAEFSRYVAPASTKSP